MWSISWIVLGNPFVVSKHTHVCVAMSEMRTEGEGSIYAKVACENPSLS